MIPPRPGLSPGKKRQALLGALTLRSTGRAKSGASLAFGAPVSLNVRRNTRRRRLIGQINGATLKHRAVLQWCNTGASRGALKSRIDRPDSMVQY